MFVEIAFDELILLNVSQEAIKWEATCFLLQLHFYLFMTHVNMALNRCSEINWAFLKNFRKLLSKLKLEPLMLDIERGGVWWIGIWGPPFWPSWPPLRNPQWGCHLTCPPCPPDNQPLGDLCHSATESAQERPVLKTPAPLTLVSNKITTLLYTHLSMTYP